MSSATFHQESHLAQQLRRDKLRFLQSPPPTMLNSYNDLAFPATSQPQVQIYNTREPFWPECVNELALLPEVTHKTSSEQRLSLSLSPNPVPEAGDVVGPLGPFTGYAAVLRGSSFLRPGQQLLEEFCRVAVGSRRTDVERGCSGWWGNLGLSFEAGGGNGRAGGGAGGSGSMNGYQFQQKLLYLQEEISRRYKQCHQQIQMVVSSFESVPGLCAATPYTSLALKSVMKHFQNLKNVINDQLNRASKIASSEFMPSPGPGMDETTTRIKYIGQSIQKEKSAGNNFNFLENSQPLWRPQRGLPERAVAVLRAWLFDHFLHPYPTDTDKHILAAQTGLSRNQVSNWFINARVRLWKPMVEEIHTLEIRGTNGMDLNPSGRNGGNQPSDCREHQSSDQMRAVHPDKMIDQISQPMINEDSHGSMEHWHREKRLRTEEWRIPTCMDGSLMSLAGYPAGMDIGGLGAVSLTLGLQHNEDAQQQQQHQMRHFGSHVVHDFVG